MKRNRISARALAVRISEPEHRVGVFLAEWLELGWVDVDEHRRWALTAAGREKANYALDIHPGDHEPDGYRASKHGKIRGSSSIGTAA